MKSIKALLAGVIIAFCGYGCLSIENKYISAFLFSFGLLTIIAKGYELFTGKIYSLKILSWEDWKIKLFMLIMNCVGAFSVGVIFRFTTEINSAALWQSKLSNSHITAFVLSFFCGVLMFLAVTLHIKEHNPLYVIMPIMLFILTGCEHCIANIFYLALAPNITIQHVIYLLINIIGNITGSLVFFNLEIKNK